MQKDIIEKIEKDFESSEEIIKILSEMASRNNEAISERIYRAIIYLSEGNIEKLNYFIDLYFQDYRDLIWQAEY